MIVLVFPFHKIYNLVRSITLNKGNAIKPEVLLMTNELMHRNVEILLINVYLRQGVERLDLGICCLLRAV